MGAALAERLKQPVVIENIADGGGQHRAGPGGEVAGGRVHAVHRQQRHGRPEHAGHQEAQLRFAQGPGAGVDCGGEPDSAGGASLGAREERGGAGGAGEGEAGHAVASG